MHVGLLIGVSGGPTLGQHKYKIGLTFKHQIAIHVKKLSEMSLVILKVYYIYYIILFR